MTRMPSPSLRNEVATNPVGAFRSRRRFARCATTIASSAFVLACTWTRFDDVTDNPPVEKFETPSSTSSLGLSVTSYPGAFGAELVVAASERIAIYDLGTGSNPSRTATLTQSCVGDNSCVLVRNLATVQSEALTGNAHCAAYGMGTVTEGTGAGSGKLWFYCEDHARHSLDLPPTMQEWLSRTRLAAGAELLVAAPRGLPTPILAAAAPDASLAWFYLGSSATPVELPGLPDGKKVGRSLAVVPPDATNSTSFIATSSQSTNEVFLFSVDATGTASLTGCLTGPEQFGRLLATGFSSDARVGLLVADASTIYALDAPTLVQAATNGPSPCTDIASTTAVKANCASLGNVDGCATRPFGASMTVASLAGDGGQQLVIGVPDATVRGESSAGAVLVYSFTGSSFKLTDSLFVSSAATGDRLGTSVAAVESGGFDRIVAGVPGDNSVVEFFCNSFVPAGAKGARCP